MISFLTKLNENRIIPSKDRARKQSVTDRRTEGQTDGQTQINIPSSSGSGGHKGTLLTEFTWQCVLINSILGGFKKRREK